MHESGGNLLLFTNFHLENEFSKSSRIFTHFLYLKLNFLNTQIAPIIGFPISAPCLLCWEKYNIDSRLRSLFLKRRKAAHWPSLIPPISSKRIYKGEDIKNSKYFTFSGWVWWPSLTISEIQEVELDEKLWKSNKLFFAAHGNYFLIVSLYLVLCSISSYAGSAISISVIRAILYATKNYLKAFQLLYHSDFMKDSLVSLSINLPQSVGPSLVRSTNLNVFS